MTLQQLRYAVKIAEEKSMNKAAAALYVSQPALSATIRDLEEEIGTELFIRSNRGILITPGGEEFLSYARQMVELSQTIEDHYVHHRVAKQKFSVSMQHYSFAVEAFITLVKELEPEGAGSDAPGTKAGREEKFREEVLQKGKFPEEKNRREKIREGSSQGEKFQGEKIREEGSQGEKLREEKIREENDPVRMEFAVHETKTGEVIENVKNGRSELGILYLNDFNATVMRKIFSENEVEFTPLFTCGISVYLSSTHPLAGRQSISFEELAPYPCLSFEQGEKNSFYFAEEVLSTREYRRIIKADDRATMLNLMTGLNGYTLCSGIICEKLNGDGYVAVPLETEETMEIGYIRRQGMPLSRLGKRYLEILRKYHVADS